MTYESSRLRITNTSRLQNAFIATGFPYRHSDEQIDIYMSMFKDVLTNSVGARRLGSSALDLAYVAAGRFDAFWEFGLKPWDIAAGALLVQEAGGVISDFSGRDKHLESGNVLAGNIKVHRQLELLIQKHVAKI